MSHPRQLPVGVHVWGEVRPGVLRCQCWSEVRYWTDLGGLERWGWLSFPASSGRLSRCTFRLPRLRVEYGPDGKPVAMHWTGF